MLYSLQDVNGKAFIMVYMIHLWSIIFHFINMLFRHRRLWRHILLRKSFCCDRIWIRFNKIMLCTFWSNSLPGTLLLACFFDNAINDCITVLNYMSKIIFVFSISTGAGVCPEGVQLLLHGHLYHWGIHEGLRPRHHQIPLRQVRYSPDTSQTGIRYSPDTSQTGEIITRNLSDR